MANLTTVGGIQYLFDPARVCMIADSAGRTMTTVYGLAERGLDVSEPVEAFLARIGMISGFARFTRPDGSPIWVNAKEVTVAWQSAPGQYAPAVRTVLSVGALTQAVTETLDEVREAVDRLGGTL